MKRTLIVTAPLLVALSALVACKSQPAKDAQEARAELSSAQMRGEGPEEIQDKQKKLLEAHDKVVRERADTYAKYQQRLAEIDKKAHDAHANSASLDPVKKSEFDRAWFTYTAEHRDVEGAMRALGTSPDAEFDTWRDRTGTQLDELERAVDALDVK